MRSSLSTCLESRALSESQLLFSTLFTSKFKLRYDGSEFRCMLNSNFWGSLLYCSWWRMVWEYHCFLVIWILICVWNYSHVCTFFILGPLRIWKLLDGGGGSSTSNFFPFTSYVLVGEALWVLFVIWKPFLFIKLREKTLHVFFLNIYMVIRMLSPSMVNLVSHSN